MVPSTSKGGSAIKRKLNNFFSCKSGDADSTDSEPSCTPVEDHRESDGKTSDGEIGDRNKVGLSQYLLF